MRGWGLVGFLMAASIGTAGAAPIGAQSAAIHGTVQPFEVIEAVRNHGFEAGMVKAEVAVSVGGGAPADWVATAVYVAEHSIIRDATFAVVKVFVPNPRGDLPPQHAKMLVEVYFAPIPARSPWSDKWTILGSARAATPADVEFDYLSAKLLEDPSKVPDPDVATRRADAAARRAVIRKYHLTASWKPGEGLGLDGSQYTREQVEFSAPSAAPGVNQLAECLNSDDGTWILRGCLRRPADDD